jgi:hypothetical protein
MAQIKNLEQARSDEFLTVEEAAKILEIKPTAIRNYLHANKLTTFKFKVPIKPILNALPLLAVRWRKHQFASCFGQLS